MTATLSPCCWPLPLITLLPQELQNPFGFDRSDIAICLLNETLRAQLEHTLADFAADTGVAPEDRIAQQQVDGVYDRNGLDHHI
jgi:predicted membrane chloride channel (bestrophin family)